MRKRYFHNKLIRDNIPEMITEAGGDFETRVMKDEEFELELKRKLVEEANELFEAPKTEILNEMADVLQLLKSIATHYEINFEDLEKFQKEKSIKRGEFSKKLFLVWSDAKSGK